MGILYKWSTQGHIINISDLNKKRGYMVYIYETQTKLQSSRIIINRKETMITVSLRLIASHESSKYVTSDIHLIYVICLVFQLHNKLWIFFLILWLCAFNYLHVSLYIVPRDTQTDRLEHIVSKVHKKGSYIVKSHDWLRKHYTLWYITWMVVWVINKICNF